MRGQPSESNPHEINLHVLRAERKSEDYRLSILKTRLNELSKQQRKLPEQRSGGQVNAA